MDQPPLCPSLLDTAVDWHVRCMSEEADMDFWNAYEAWLAENPAHVAAALEVDQMLALVESSQVESGEPSRSAGSTPR